MLFLDLGNGVVTYLDSATDKHGTIKADKFFQWTLTYPAGTIIVGEAAHFGTPRKKLSKAQYWYPEELLQWYSDLKSAGIELYLAAENETYKYRKKFNIEQKDDLQDATALRLAVELQPSLLKNMKRPVDSFIPRPEVLEGNEARQVWGDDANVSRNFDYIHETDMISKWLYDNILELRDRLDPETVDIMRISDKAIYWQANSNVHGYSKGDRRPQGKMFDAKWQVLKPDGKPTSVGMRSPVLTAILSCVLTLDGKPRVRESTGQLAGWRWVKDEILMLKSYRPRKGGVIRSNCTYWGLSQYTCDVLGTKNGNKMLPLHDYSEQQLMQRKVLVKKWKNALHDLFKTYKAMVSEQFEQELNLSTSIHELQNLKS